jgi:pre-peptidase
VSSIRGSTRFLRAAAQAGTSLLLLFALSGVASAFAQSPTSGSWREEIQRLKDRARVPRAPRASVARSSATIITESEPNNSIATADSAALGDQATGTINPVGDADAWFVDLTAGLFFSVDVDAQTEGSPLDATLELLAPDGHSLAFNDDFDGFDSRISYRIAASGRYYAVIRAFGNTGGVGQRYAINFGTVVCEAVGTEQEPNDAPATATRVAIGDSAVGDLCARDANPAGDVDYWAFTGQAGMTIELDVDAASHGLLVDPAVALFASDGTTRVAFNDDADGTDPRLQYSITVPGTYYAAVFSVSEPGGNPFPYSLHVRTVTPGPGDPITIRAEHLGLALGLAFGSDGDLFVSDLVGSRVVRVSGQGAATTFATGIPNPTGIAFDAFGGLLVASPNGVYRVTPQGQTTRFLSDVGFAVWVAVGSDGRIWVTDLLDRSLRRYSPTGRFETKFALVSIGGSGPGPLAIGPSGEPYFSNGTEIWKLTSDGPRQVLSSPFVIWGFAFDVTGRIYAPAPAAGRLLAFEASGATRADPYAVGPDAPFAVAFARDETGATLARLFATDLLIGQVIEVNPAGVPDRGLALGILPPPFSLEVAAQALLGAGVLSPSDLQYLDALGNHNGRYDVGDFSAFVRTVQALEGSNR